MKDRKSVFDCKVELEEFPVPKIPFPDGIGYGLTEDEKASLRIIRLEREIVRTKGKLIELNQELDDLIEEMIP